MHTKRITLKEIAVRAGVHTSTVCIALKNNPMIPQVTRDRIRKLAEELGYQPDPMLTALASYRSALRPAAFHGQLAWLSSVTPRFNWRKVPVYATYMEGAQERARRLGYTLTDYNLGDRGMSPRRLADIMRARGVRGIVVCPMPEAHTTLDFPWEGFSAVSLGSTLEHPTLHLVAANQYESVRRIFRELRQLGYTRIGLALPGDLNTRVGERYLAGYLIEQRAEPAARRLAPYLEMPPSRAGFARWLKRTRPDAIITSNYIFPDYLTQLGVQAPADLGVAVVFKRVAGDRFAGIDQNVKLTGEVAMDLLASMIQRNETGVPVHPQQTFVEGKWMMGETVRALTAR